MRLRLVLAVLVVGVGSGLVLTPAAPGQDDLEVARTEVRDATERLESLLERLEETQRRGNELAGEYWQVESGLQLLDLQLADAETERAELAEERRELLGEVRRIALDRYMDRSLNRAWDDLETIADREAAEALAELFVGSDQGTLDRLAAVDDEYERGLEELDAQRERQEAALDEVVATQRAITEELEELARLRDALDRELLRLERSLGALEAAEAERLAEAERERLAEERRRAEQAAARAVELARVPAPVPTASPVPNPQPGEPTATPVPNPQPSEPTATPVAVPTATPVPNPQPSGGGIVCPLAGPFTHTDDFNAPRAVGGVHRANDLIAATGTPALAVASGMVEHRESPVGGLSARLRGDNGDFYFYTHLSGYENVGIGHVSAGMVIGYVGMTGNAPIPHLHFEIHRGGYGNYTNPYGPVRQACGT